MISLFDLMYLVYKNMSQTRLRVFFTISGIIIGIFTFTVFIFLSQGLENAITGQFGAFGLSVLGVQSISGSSVNGPPSGGDLTDTDVVKIKQVVREVKYVAPQLFYIGQYERGKDKADSVSLGFPEEFYEDVSADLGLEFSSGRNLKIGDSGVVIIGAKAAREFDEDNPVRVGNNLKINGTSLRVVGVIEERGDLFIDSSIIMPFDTIQDISGSDTYTNIRVSFFEGADLELYEKAIDQKLNPNGDEKRVQITSPKDVIEQFESIIGVLQAIVSVVSIIAILVGGINVMNTMYSNVLERINEISVIKALGGTNNDILFLFLIESGILGLVGALIGFFGAYGLGELISFFIENTFNFNFPVNFDPTFFAIVIGLTTLAAMLFGTYPAVKAGRIDPADNLRDE